MNSYSYSSLDVYKICPKRYYYRFIERMPWYPSAATSFGSSIHNTIYHFLKEFTKDTKITQQSIFPDEPMPIRKVDLLQTLDDRWIEVGYESRNQMIERKKRAIALLSSWFDNYSSSWNQIFQMERSFSMLLDSYHITGRFDRIDKEENGLHIIDYKTGRLHEASEIVYNEQLHLYAMAAEALYNTPVSRVSLYFFEHDVWQSCRPRKEHIEVIRKNLIERITNIEQEIFSPLPEEKKCAQCPYASLCKPFE